MIRLLLSTAAAALLAGCASQLQTSQTLFGLVTPYRMELVQGNVITQELLARVRPGLNRRQVRDLLGTPLLTDVFHGNRWDYVFVIERQGQQAQRRNVVLRFDGDVLASIDAGELPTEQQFVSSITREAKYPDRKLELTEEERAALPKPPARAASAAEPSGPVRPYPPLEGE
ncbi:outer membrane protein assembly factor BamE [Rubrivivax albus]|uniref:Outer membrane protein assembly factor BamE n=1 Tax=Rubrivivax albus TaxID=2499835 RepID=A0A3S2U9U7_9BURK|nr:outer membrane protein assembly factor BamE [Rubrivivax albus]RVT52495.1 outer membrane protein assembly factor BamE [Rubrivivax albus]